MTYTEKWVQALLTLPECVKVDVSQYILDHPHIYQPGHEQEAVDKAFRKRYGLIRCLFIKWLHK